MQDLLNALKQHAGAMDAQAGQARMGIVANVNAAAQTVRVTWDEDGTLSGDLPLAMPLAGNGWGVAFLPEPGDQVFVEADMGEQASGIALGYVHSTRAPVPRVQGYKQNAAEPVQPGEMALVHKSGTFLRLRADGTVEIKGNLFVTGDILATGQVRDLDGERGTVEQLRSAYNQHKNAGVRAGGELSGLTDKPVP